MIPGFIEGVIGMNIKDEKILKCEFPKDYHQEEAKGRKEGKKEAKEAAARQEE